MNDKINCPQCESENIEAKQKGFNGQNAAIGAWLFGGIGFFIAGNKGSKEVMVNCFDCKFEWNYDQVQGIGFKDFKHQFYALYEQKQYEKAEQLYVAEFNESLPDLDFTYKKFKKEDKKTLIVTVVFGIFIALMVILLFIF